MRDGEQVVTTIAYAWTTRLVLVEVSDPRAPIRGTWLAPADVERMTEPGIARP